MTPKRSKQRWPFPAPRTSPYHAVQVAALRVTAPLRRGCVAVILGQYPWSFHKQPGRESFCVQHVKVTLGGPKHGLALVVFEHCYAVGHRGIA